MMTINDMTEQITIQGKVIVKNWKDDDMVITWVGTDEPNNIPKALRDAEILFMYPQDNGIVIEVNTSYDAKLDAWKNYLDYELEDDDTPNGGTDFVGETLGDFLDEMFFGMGATHDDNDEVTCYNINEALKQCGIKPINFKED